MTKKMTKPSEKQKSKKKPQDHSLPKLETAVVLEFFLIINVIALHNSVIVFFESLLIKY